MAITWAQALAWRARRHLLDPVGDHRAEDVVRRLSVVPAASDDAAELAVRVRQRASEAGEIGQALADGRLVRTYAFRGATHLVTPSSPTSARTAPPPRTTCTPGSGKGWVPVAPG